MAMTCYRVSFFKNLLSSDGHPFKVVQRVLEVRDCQNADEAISAAQRRFAELERVPSWTLHADCAEVAMTADSPAAAHRSDPA